MPTEEALRLMNLEWMMETAVKDGREGRWVDATNGSDESFTGKSRKRPFATIQHAVDDIDSVGLICILTGDYAENVVCSDANIEFRGIIRDGSKRSAIVPTSGVAMTLEQGGCRVSDMALITEDDHCLKATGPDPEFDNLYLDLTSDGASTRIALWLNNADRASVQKCIFDGNNDEDTIGILVGDGTIEAEIINNTIENFGSELGGGALNGYGIGLHGGSQSSLIEDNKIAACYQGVYIYAPTVTYCGHGILNNRFAENNQYDVYDPTDPDDYGTFIDGNQYIYAGWFGNPTHNGLAGIVVDCYGNKDYHPQVLAKARHTARIDRFG